MTSVNYRNGLRLISLVKSDGTLELSLERTATPEPASDEVVIRIEAAPLNPSDLGLLLAGADLDTVRAVGTPENPILVASIPEKNRKALASRTEKRMPVGNEAAGTVVAAGSSVEAQSLIGKKVAALSGGMYAEYRCLKVTDCLLLPAGATAVEGASSFVNPLTALGMVETMRREGHTALVHTAAASNLGQMLNRICLKDKVGLVNVVRRREQAEILRSLGAAYVCETSSSSFQKDLTAAIGETGATLGFDATGGGRLAGQILSAMETALIAAGKEATVYGTTIHKQVYLYGGLDTSPTELVRNFGMAWGVGGWLLRPFLHRVGREMANQLKARVAAELKTTFASHYSNEVSLLEALQPQAIAVYGQRATGGKFLIVPPKN